MIIRRWQAGEEGQLRQVFESALRGLASRYYDAAQIEAWAARLAAPDAWCERIERTAPWVCEINGALVAYADVQASGYIDHFFVGAAHARRGIGHALLQHQQGQAIGLGCPHLHTDASLAAEAFFAHHGFAAQERRQVVLEPGVALTQVHMRKKLG